MVSAYSKKPRAGQLKSSDVQAAVNGNANGFVAPNSAYIGSGSANPDLENMLRSRIQEQFSMNQNAEAEAEADKYASLVKGAGNIDEVKQELGHQMGADFSSVKIHTGAQAEKSTDTIGALAYTAGKNVYIGGAFNPQTTAHELVHTVQQGQVESAAPTVTAVDGGVQMLGNPLKKLFGKKETVSAPKQPAQIAKVPDKIDFLSPEFKSLKSAFRGGASVARVPSAGDGPDVVVKPDTIPELEEALADLYNVSSSVRSSKRKCGWGFDAPAARGIRDGEEKDDLTELFDSGRLSAFIKNDTTTGADVRTSRTTLFSLVSGSSRYDSESTGIVNKCAVESRPKIKYFFDCSVVAPFLRSGA